MKNFLVNNIENILIATVISAAISTGFVYGYLIGRYDI